MADKSELSNSHSSSLLWIPVDIASDLLYTGANAVSAVVTGAGHTLAEGVRDITGDHTAFGGNPEEATHGRNVLWLPVDLVTGIIHTGTNVVHHVVTGVANAVIDTADNIQGSTK